MRKKRMHFQDLLFIGLAVLVAWLAFDGLRGAKASPDVTAVNKNHVVFAGESWSPERLSRHACVIGQTGSGKTFSTNDLLSQMMRNSPMILTCVKHDDCERYRKIAESVGCGDRFVRMAPDTGPSMNLMTEYLKPHNAVVAAAHTIAGVGAVGSRYQNAEVGDNAFWVAQSEPAICAAIRLNLRINGRVDIPSVYKTLVSTPSSSADLALPEWRPEVDCVRRTCADLIVRGDRMGLATAGDVDYINESTYLMHEIGGGGDRQRGGIIAQAMVTLGPFIDRPWDAFFSPKVPGITPELIEQKRLIVALDMPELVWKQPGRMGQAAVCLAVQNYLLRRPFLPGMPITGIWRDEAPRIVTDEDSEALLVARSQGIAFFDLFQDVNALRGAFGGEKGKDRAWTFLQNHATSYVFNTTSLDTTKWLSAVIGQGLKIRISGGGSNHRRPQESGDLLDDCLGVRGEANWQQSWEPLVRPEQLSRLPVGVALVLTGGSYRFVDFRK